MPGSDNPNSWFLTVSNIPKKVNMKSLIQQASAFSSTGSKVVLALIFTSAISVFSISSALAEHDNGHHGRGKWRGNYGHQKGPDNRDNFLYRPRGMSSLISMRNQSTYRRRYTILHSNRPASVCFFRLILVIGKYLKKPYRIVNRREKVSRLSHS